MRSEIENYDISGHLQVVKIFEDGTEEVHYDNHNVITSGMGVGLSYLFAGSGSTSITDYQIRYYQVGVSAFSTNPPATTYELSAPLTTANYGTSSDNVLSTHSQITNATTITSQPFVKIPFSNIYRTLQTSIRFDLILGRFTANNLANPLNEVGLFMSNPKGSSPEESILVAYRTFTDLQKSSEFAVVFRWTLSF